MSEGANGTSVENMVLSDICVAVGSVRTNESIGLVENLLGQRHPPGEIAIAFQGSATDFEILKKRASEIARRYSYSGMHLTKLDVPGLSNARNRAIDLLQTGAQWVWTPNDTTRVDDGVLPSLLWSAADLPPNTGAIAMNYRVSNSMRRNTAETKQLEGWGVWKAIEPATLWRRGLLQDLDFDPSIGTGSQGWAQSGEGTDLLARIEKSGYTIRTVPVEVLGQPMHRDRRLRGQLAKTFYYGVGFGVVCRRHFGLGRSSAAALSPALSCALRRRREGDLPGVTVSIAESVGRALGLLLGERSTAFRRRGAWE